MKIARCYFRLFFFWSREELSWLRVIQIFFGNSFKRWIKRADHGFNPPVCLKWSAVGEAGQRVLMDSHSAYRAGRASSRRSRPVWPLSTAHFHNISGVSALRAEWSTHNTHIHTHTHTHKLCTPSAPCCGGGQGLACHPGSGVRGRGGSREMGK